MKELKLIFKHSKGVRVELLFGSLFLSLGTVCLLVTKYLEKELIDTVFKSLKWNLLFDTLLLYGLISGAGLIADTLGPYILVKIQTKLRVMLYNQLLKAIYKLSTPDFLAHKIGKYMNHFNYDVVMASMIYIYSIPEVILQLISMMIILYILLTINPWLLIFTVICSFLYVVIHHWIGEKTKVINYEIANKKSNITTCVEEGISASREIISWNRKNWATDRLENAYEDYLDTVNREIKLASKGQVLGDAIEWFPKVMVLIVGGYAIVRGHYTLGMVYMIYQYISKGMVSANLLFTHLIRIKKYVVSLERLEQMIESSDTECNKLLLNDAVNSITFDRVRFRYPSTNYDVLNTLSLNILIGRTTGIAGLSGGGKSTIIQLLAGFYQPDDGAIYINGTSLGDYKRSQLNQQMSVVFQEPYFFACSIKDNIIMGRENIDDKHMIEVCKKVAILDFIHSLPQGFDTILEERGINLSGGQRQRIALVRALIGNPEILILDEATSALDVQTEGTVMNNIKQLRKGKTTLVIAHRLSTIQNADHIVILNKGRVLEDGTHDELCSKSVIYRELISSQVN